MKKINGLPYFTSCFHGTAKSTCIDVTNVTFAQQAEAAVEKHIQHL